MIILPESAFIEFPIDEHLRGIVGSARWQGMTHEQKRDFGAFQVAKAKDRGELFPGCCAVCGTCESIEAHHPDYEKPTRIAWLCVTHHVRLHRNDPEFMHRLRESRRLTKAGIKISGKLEFRLPGCRRRVSARLGQVRSLALTLYCRDHQRTKSYVGFQALCQFLQSEGYLPSEVK